MKTKKTDKKLLLKQATGVQLGRIEMKVARGGEELPEYVVERRRHISSW